MKVGASSRRAVGRALRGHRIRVAVRRRAAWNEGALACFA